MPELADVEGWRRYVARFVAGREVLAVRVRDAQVVRGTTPQGLGRALHGRRLGAPGRHGKWLLVPVDGGRLVLHFGMTGELSWSSRTGDLEKRDLVVLELEGGELRYRARRKLGGLWWVPERGSLEEVTGPLGPDAAAVDLDGFRALLEGRRGTIKSALMDQSLLAGLGNELSDEVLWSGRVRPATPVARLAPERLDALHRALRHVLSRSMRRGRVPDSGRWLNAVRGREDPRCPRCGTAVERGPIAGRTSCWCPRCQR